ncbi:hypothetical protein Tsubulata_038010 [Turnera subulata]|uniref:F-box domain-containing protein n=1 Tax=Turnera subulata TaxID=218843 RepID=A0A9Q0GAK8_9ROSI|nr:hypothetical protein Tsubulata_038010 [Turnera subulata]
MGQNISTLRNIGNLQPSFLPLELITEILNRVAVKDMLRFKCVSKELNHLIGDRYFVQKHLDHSPSGTFRVVKQSFVALQSRDGLILERNKHSRELRVRNPAMGQEFYIPKPHKRNRLVWFGFAPTSGFYKLVSMYDSIAGNGYGGVEILVLGIEDKPSWKPADSTHLHSYDRNDRLKVCVAEAVGHIAKTSTIQSRDYEVMTFDLDTENFCGHKLVPRSVFPEGSDVSLAYGDEWPFLVALANDELHILGLQDCLQEAKLRDCEEGMLVGKKTIIPLSFLKENPEMRRNIEVERISLHSQSIKFCRNREFGFIYYIREERKGPETCIGQDGKFTCLAYKSSLVTFKGMRPQPLEER